jgi:transcriptional regulator with XRE-family HTH domain
LNSGSTTFGLWLRESRIQRGLDLETLSARSGVDRSSINRIEREVSQPTLLTAVRLCAGLNVGPEEVAWALQGRHLRVQSEQPNEPSELVVSVADLNLLVQLLRRDWTTARRLFVGWLNQLAQLHRDVQTTRHGVAESQWIGDGANHFRESDVDKLLADVAFYRFEIQFPPPLDGPLVAEIFRQGGAITLRDVGAYVRWLRMETRKSLADMRASVEISDSALSRLETGQLEQVRFIDLLLLDEALGAEGEVLNMSWAACALSPAATRQGDRISDSRGSGAAGGKAHLGKAQEDQAKDGAGILLRLQPGVGAELVGGIPQALFQRRGGGVFFRGSDPAQAVTPRGG